MTLGAARVIWSVNDLSLFVDEIVRGYVSMIIQAERGPINEPQIISSMEDYRRVYGRKVDYTTDPLVCEMALRQGARLILNRVAHYTDPADTTTLTAAKSTVTISDRGGTALVGYVDSATGPFTMIAPVAGSVTGDEVENFTFGVGASDAMLIAVGSGADQPVTLSGSGQTAAQVAAAINAATTGLTATDEDGLIKITADAATDSIAIKAVTHDAYSVLGLTEGTYAAVAGTNSLTVNIAGESAQTFVLTAGTRTSAQVVADLAALTGGTASSVDGKVRISTTATGTAATVAIASGSTADTPLGCDNTTHTGFTGAPVATLKFDAANEGEWGDSLLIQVSSSYLNPDDHFNVKVIHSLQGELTETYPDLSMDATNERYAVTYINERSRLVAVTDMASTNPSPANIPANNSSGYALTGGDNGLEGFCDADWIGSEANQTGIYSVDSQPYMSMDLMIPGSTSVTVYQAMIAYCETRGDMIAYGQVPYGMTPEECVEWRLGDGNWTHAAFNSYRFTLFFGRPFVYDDRDDSRRYISCLGHLAACLCRTDNNYGYHFAPVGPRRGAVTFVEDIDFNIQGTRSTGYADLFAEYGINYLFISHIRGIEGAMFWEQRTTQRAASALRELNVVRFITMLNRALMPVLRMFLFEPNHPVTWREIYRVLEPAFKEWKDRYAIYDFALQCDQDAFFDGGVLMNAVLNSGLDIDRGIYHCRALIQPTRTIYYLEFELGVMRTGEAFEKYTQLKELPGWIR